MNYACRLALCAIALACPGPAVRAQQKDETLAPAFDKAVLRAGERVVRPARTGRASRHGYSAGSTRVEIEGRQIRGFRDDKPVWLAEAPADVVWLGSGRDGAYLVPFSKEEDAPLPTSEHLRVLDVETGQWRPSLSLAASAGVLGVLDTEKGLVVSAATNEDTLVALFERADGKLAADPLWRIRLPRIQIGAEAEDGAFLMAAARPDRASAGVRPLTLMAGRVLVCPDPRQPIAAVTLATGAVEWSLERPWEFQRGFVGPSVWQHFMSRLGVDSMFGEQPAPEVRQAFESSTYGTLLAGPVPCGADSFFVVTGKGPVGPWTNYVMEPSALEVDSSGKPVAIAAIPRRPLGTLFDVHEGRVVWACQSDLLVCLAPSDPQARNMGMGPGGFDCVTDVRWMRGCRPEPTAAWLSAPGVEGLAVFAGRFAYLAPDGMRIEKAEEKLVRMTLQKVCLHDGTMTTMTLEVPFTGEASLPVTNYSSGPSGVRSSGPYLMSVTGLEVVNDRLVVTVGEEGKATLVEFLLTDLLDVK